MTWRHWRPYLISSGGVSHRHQLRIGTQTGQIVEVYMSYHLAFPSLCLSALIFTFCHKDA